MKCTIPEISWHNRDPVLSVDIQPVQNDFYKLATGGSDSHILMWNLKIRNNGSVDVHAVCDLSRHQRSVNVVRWSPTGTYLASGDDDANIIIWILKTDSIPLLEEEEEKFEECWLVHKILRGHKEDVYDICWSPDETKLISGSIDNTAILWDIVKGQSQFILSDHKGFVQGVQWDPKGELIATISSDRVCRIFDNTGKHVRARIHKGLLPVPEFHTLYEKEIKYFHDDTFKSYFRRLSFSPDGNLLIVPSGSIDVENYNQIRNATYIFSISELGQPIAIIPSSKQVTIAVRCCPILFQLHSDGPNPLIDLPYRIVFAIATDSDVILYDTQQITPFAHFRKVHYTRITDLTWSPDGLLLIASSTDGFCTLITFDTDEIGVQYVKDDSETEDNALNISGCEEFNNGDVINETEVKKPNILEKWTVRTPKSDAFINQPEPQKLNKPVQESIKKIVPKRIAPVRIGDCSKAVEKNEEAEKDTTDIVMIDDALSDSISNSNDNKKDDELVLQNKNKQDESKKANNAKNSILNFFQASSNKTPQKNKTGETTEQLKLDAENSSKTIISHEVVELSDSDSNPESSSTKNEKIELDVKKSVEKENVKNNLDSPDRNQVANSVHNLELRVNTVKTPRRIPFVTLASPKRKKKE